MKALMQPPKSYNNWGINSRAPVVGDTSTLVEILRSPGVSPTYVVECVNPDGSAEWLADFCEAELEKFET